MEFTKKFILLLILSFSGILLCNQPEPDKENFFPLNDWEINIGSGWVKTRPVPWETPVENGGPGFIDYDGIGYYRTSFYLPGDFLNKSIAFYTECIDDSDVGILNGNIIGETGKVPTESGGTGSIGASNFRSGVRDARLYLLPEKFFYKDRLNELVLKVYDFSGSGGFCNEQKPVIGIFNELKKLEVKHRNINDIPRSIFLSFLLFLIIFHIIKFSTINPPVSCNSVLKSIMMNLNIKSFFLRAREDENHDIDIEVAGRYLLCIFICAMSLFFLFSEVTYKYYFIESEIFWFKTPPIIFFLQLMMLLLMFHQDVFGSGLSRSGSRIKIFCRGFLSIVSHPLAALIFLIYSCVIPAEKAWSHFILMGLSYGIASITILFGITGLNIIKAGRSEISEFLHRHFQWEGIARLLLILFMIATFVFAIMNIFIGYQSLFMHFFLILYMLMSVSFLSNRRIKLPINLMEKRPLFTILQINFQLTYKESSIACLIFDGYTRNDICGRLNITNETLKKHLTSIYDKTINRESGMIAASRDKFQRITLFLNRITPNMK